MPEIHTSWFDASFPVPAHESRHDEREGDVTVHYWDAQMDDAMCVLQVKVSVPSTDFFQVLRSQERLDNLARVLVDAQIEDVIRQFRQGRFFKKRPKVSADFYEGAGEFLRRSISISTRTSGRTSVVMACSAGVGDAAILTALCVSGDESGFKNSEDFMRSLRLPDGH